MLKRLRLGALQLLARTEAQLARVAATAARTSQFGIVRDRWVRRALWQRLPTFWTLRQRARRTRFEIARWRYGIVYSYREHRLTAGVGFQILRAVIPSSVLAFVLVLVLRSIDLLVAQLDLPALLAGLERVLARSRFRFDSGATANLYSTTAQIGGVFVGLYFTALSLLASTSYREVPADLRRVVIQERAGLLYLRVVAFASAAALYCLGLQAVGIEPGLLNAAAVTVLSALSLLSFVVLGLRSFTFFDPSALATYLSVQVLDAARAATPNGFGWDDPAIQAHQQRLARQAASSLRRLVAVTAAAPLAGEALREVANRTLATIGHYAALRVEIPHESHWFVRTVDHKSWLTASDYEIRFAFMGGFMQTTQRPDYLWLDRELIETVVHASRELLERHEFQKVALVGSDIMGLLDQLTSQFQLESAEYLEAAFARLAIPIANKLKAGETSTDAEENLGPIRDQLRVFQLAALDVTVAGPCGIIPGFGRAARELRSQGVLRLAERTSEGLPGAPLSAALPAEVRAMLHSLRLNLQFERDVERTVHTPPRHRADLVAKAYTTGLLHALNTVVLITKRAYIWRCKELYLRDASPDAVVAILQRGFEALHKLRAHADALSEALAVLRTFRLDFHDDTWDVVDMPKIESDFTQIEDTLLRALAEVAKRTPAKRPSSELPDVFGYCFTTLEAYAFRALLTKPPHTFAYLFRTILPMCFVAKDRIIGETTRLDLDTRFRFASDVVLDLTELSGFAYIVDHTIGGDVWEAVVEAWDVIFAAATAADALLEFLVKVEELRAEPSFIITPRELVRTGWRQEFDRWLERNGFSGGRKWNDYGQSDDIRAEPLDVLAHAFVRRGNLGEHARDVFFATYLKERIAEAGLRMTPGGQTMLDSADRLRKHRNDALRDQGPLSESWQRTSLPFGVAPGAPSLEGDYTDENDNLVEDSGTGHVENEACED